MSPALGITILLIATIAAILSGVAVFTNIAPEPHRPDPRVGELQDALRAFEEDINKTLEDMQKALLLMEHRLGKEAAERRDGIKVHMDAHAEALLKAVHDINAEEEM